MTLTKKYRLVWGDDKQLISNPFQEYPSNSETIVGVGMNAYETQTIPTIENKIASEGLIFNEDF